MNCPVCFMDNPVHRDHMAATDQLWMEFESQVSIGYLECVYYCRHCSYYVTRKFDPEVIMQSKLEEEE